MDVEQDERDGEGRGVRRGGIHREKLRDALKEGERKGKELLSQMICATKPSKRNCQNPEHPYEHVQPENLTLEQVKNASPDRFDLDSVVFDVLGLTDDERLEVYRAVAQLVKDRLVKAKSVRRQPAS